MKEKIFTSDASFNEILSNTGIGERGVTHTFGESTKVEGIHNGWLVTKDNEIYRTSVMVFIPK
jgi:hypothetical protein